MSSINPTITTIKKPTEKPSSAIADAINSTTATNLTKLQTTYQLVNTLPSQTSQQQQQRISTTAPSTANKTQLIQRIHSFQNTTQPITKTIVSGATNQAAASSYKVLSQQLPAGAQTNTNPQPQLTAIKSINPANKLNNPIVITKTISSSNLTSDERPKQIITTVKNDSVTNRPVITATAATTSASVAKPVSITPVATTAGANSNGSASSSAPIRTTAMTATTTNSNSDKAKFDLSTRGFISQANASNQAVNSGVRLGAQAQPLNK